MKSDKIQYFLYTRKSSESEDRQVASIESQIDVLKELAKREGLEIVEVFSEARSAKAPGRSVFGEMIERIHKGEATGILCWKLDRLARNPIDGGQIVWMLQKGVIQHIQTYERSYLSADNVLMMSVEFGMANQFILDLSLNTKRGLKSKAEKGWFPGRAPIGYMNNKFRDKGQKDIIRDSERFDLVRKLWDLLLSRQYSVKQLYEIATNEWGLTLSNGKRMVMSRFYDVFINPFYYGHFLYGGVLYKGNHEAMITLDEYQLAQEILGRVKARPRTHSFPFTGMMYCGECSSMITAEQKIKRQKNGNVHSYIYYRCTKKKNAKCTQKCVEQQVLEQQIGKILSAIEIPQQFFDWAMDVVRGEAAKESAESDKIRESQTKAYNAVVRRIDALLEMRMANEIDQQQFSSKKLELLAEKAKLQGLLADSDNRVDSWIGKFETAFNFALAAKNKFETGSVGEKKEILACLGSNLLLKNRQLSISLIEPLSMIKDFAVEVNKIHSSLEPVRKPMNKEELAQIYASNSVLGA